MAHEVLCAVLRVCSGELQVLMWQRALEPQRGRWSLPGGTLRADEDVEASVRRQLAEKVDVRRLSHLEQLAVFSDPRRRPAQRTLATGFLGLVPTDVDPAVPQDTAWHRVEPLPCTAFDHAAIVDTAHRRLRAKLSYTSIGSALAPREFTIAELRGLYSASLGYPISATNLQRVLSRRGVLVATGVTRPSGHSGGRPAALYSFAAEGIHITDPFAILRPPTS